MNWQQAGWIIKLQLVAINFQFLTDSGHHGKNMSAPLKEHYLHNQPFFFLHEPLQDEKRRLEESKKKAEEPRCEMGVGFWFPLLY